MHELDNNTVVSYLGTVVNAVKDMDERLSKNEKLLLTSFSYLYNNNDNYLTNLDNLIEKLNSLQTKTDTLETNLENLANKYEIKINELETQLKSKKLKAIKQRKRPWYWIFIKNRKYRQLLKEKRKVEEQIEQKLIAKQQELERLEQERILKQKELERKAQEEQERKRQETQRQIREILMNINKKEG